MSRRFGTHLLNIHNVPINKSICNFRNLDEFTTWFQLENKEVNYACHRRNKHFSGEEHVYYNCIRSNSKGHVSKCEQRSAKSKGSIKIGRICPSRILAEILPNGIRTHQF
ncbi:hypothetical protein ABEB36_010818 [Hypothenemus hampei]|uniref:Uncharacterized protein n=1 Tax=Hypothenemus hampei TaxID=57062 RepID=A0ABD1ED52_HYPHA